MQLDALLYLSAHVSMHVLFHMHMRSAWHAAEVVWRAHAIWHCALCVDHWQSGSALHAGIWALVM